MDKLISVFASWQVFLVAFASYIILHLIRTVGTKKEDGVPVGGWARSKWFMTLLPFAPYIIAMGLVFIPGVPLPEVAKETIAVKVLIGFYSGWLSDKSYQVIKNVLEKAFGMQFGDEKAKAKAAVEAAKAAGQA